MPNIDAEPEVTVFPRGVGGDGPPTAVIEHRGCELELRFASEDFRGKGPIEELCIRPGTSKLEPRVLRRFAPQAELYVAYARSAMRTISTEDGSVKERHEAFRGATEALREIGGPGRGLPRAFYEKVANHYRALLDEGEPHPIKALAEANHVSISAASRWVSGARDLRLLPKKKRSAPHA